MSDFNDENDALNEAYWNDPVGVIAAAVNQAVIGAAQQQHAQQMQDKLAEQAGQVEAAMRQRLGDEWDKYRDQAAALAGQHSLVTYGEPPELIAETLADVVGSLKQAEAKQRAAEIEAENEKWRQQIRDANAPGFHL